MDAERGDHSAPKICFGPPGDFQSEEIDDFVAFVLAGGEVTGDGLKDRVMRAPCISYLRVNGCLLGVAGLKSPEPGYRKGVSANSKTELTEGQFPYELGWVFILPSARERKLSFPLCQPLITAAKRGGIFATSRTTLGGMHRTLEKLGFARTGSEWPSKQNDGNLALFIHGRGTGVMTTYGRHSTDFRQRARKLLDDGRYESLFYAALEIRLGVEARLKEYLAVQDHITKAKRDGWRVAHLGKSIEAAFKTGDKIARLTVLHAETQEQIGVLLYTPVTKRLQKLTQRLGDYLHVSDTDMTTAWWTEFRALLETAWAELAEATRGQLLGVPLMNPRTRQVRMSVQFEKPEDTTAHAAALEAAGSKVIIKVEYLESN